MSLSKSQLLKKVKQEIVEVAADQVHHDLQAGKPLRLVDVREREEVMDGYISGAALIPRGFLELNVEDEVSADRDTPIVLYCGGGFRSALAGDALQRMGYRNVRSMAGGIKAWGDAALRNTQVHNG